MIWNFELFKQDARNRLSRSQLSISESKLKAPLRCVQY